MSVQSARLAAQQADAFLQDTAGLLAEQAREKRRLAAPKLRRAVDMLEDTAAVRFKHKGVSALPCDCAIGHIQRIGLITGIEYVRNDVFTDEDGNRYPYETVVYNTLEAYDPHRLLYRSRYEYEVVEFEYELRMKINEKERQSDGIQADRERPLEGA